MNCALTQFIEASSKKSLFFLQVAGFSESGVRLECWRGFESDALAIERFFGSSFGGQLCGWASSDIALCGGCESFFGGLAYCGDADGRCIWRRC